MHSGVFFAGHSILTDGHSITMLFYIQILLSLSSLNYAICFAPASDIVAHKYFSRGASNLDQESRVAQTYFSVWLNACIQQRQ